MQIKIHEQLFFFHVKFVLYPFKFFLSKFLKNYSRSYPTTFYLLFFCLIHYVIKHCHCLLRAFSPNFPHCISNSALRPPQSQIGLTFSKQEFASGGCENIFLIVDGIKGEALLGGGNIFVKKVIVDPLDEEISLVNEFYLFVEKLSGGILHELGAYLIL